MASSVSCKRCALIVYTDTLYWYCEACISELAESVRRSPTEVCSCCEYLNMLTDLHLPLDDTFSCKTCLKKICGKCILKDGQKKGQCFKCAFPRKAFKMRNAVERAGGREVCLLRENTLMYAFREAEKKAIKKCKEMRAAQGITEF